MESVDLRLNRAPLDFPQCSCKFGRVLSRFMFLCQLSLSGITSLKLTIAVRSDRELTSLELGLSYTQGSDRDESIISQPIRLSVGCFVISVLRS